MRYSDEGISGTSQIYDPLEASACAEINRQSRPPLMENSSLSDMMPTDTHEMCCCERAEFTNTLYDNGQLNACHNERDNNNKIMCKAPFQSKLSNRQGMLIELYL